MTQKIRSAGSASALLGTIRFGISFFAGSAVGSSLVLGWQGGFDHRPLASLGRLVDAPQRSGLGVDPVLFDLAENVRRTLAERFVKLAAKRTLLLKGARTVIATAGEVTLFNTTGHPGMASGGMGDVLSGVCGALLAQGFDTATSARIGVCVHSKAACEVLSALG